MILRNILVLITLSFVFANLAHAQSPEFDNPIAEQRADPWVHKTDEGIYYLIATVPEYDRIVIRKAKSINRLQNAGEKTVWRAHKKGVMANHIWAPELHRIDGKWYIYFAAGASSDQWKIRMYALSSSADDPMAGTWKEEGRIDTDHDSFSLDATTFTHNGKRFMIWAERVKGVDGTALVLSEMKNPTTLTGPEVILTKPEFNWERMKYNVNEGAAVIKRNGKIFVTYSASATNHNYCVGLLWIYKNAEMLNSSNWNKSPGPVFYTNEELDRYGPGHNSFTTTRNGETDVMIYHARNYKEIEGHELDDPNRHTRARIIEWTESGFPDFMQNRGD